MSKQVNLKSTVYHYNLINRLRIGESVEVKGYEVTSLIDFCCLNSGKLNGKRLVILIDPNENLLETSAYFQLITKSGNDHSKQLEFDFKP